MIEDNKPQSEVAAHEEKPAHHEHHPSGDCCTLWDRIPPKMAFWAGVVTSAAVLSLIGLIILVTFILKGGDFTKKTASTSGTTTNTSTATTNTNTSTDPLAAYVYYPTGKVDLTTQRNVRGSGDFMIVEFSDFECPFCKRFSPVMEQLIEKYDGKLKWSYRHFDTGLHTHTAEAAMASECAADQGKFWDFHDKVFELSGTNAQIETTTLPTAADQAGLDRAKYDSCLSAKTHLSRVTADTTEAKSIGSSLARLGTPFPVLVDKDGKILLSFKGALDFNSAVTVLDNYIK